MSKRTPTFGEALRTARGTTSARELAERMTAAGYPVSPQGVGTWERDENPPRDADRVFALERVLDLEPGTLSQLLGFLPLDYRPIVTVADALAADTSLSPVEREALIASYRVFSRRKK